MYITTTMCDGVLHCLLFLMFFSCPYMAINVNVTDHGWIRSGSVNVRKQQKQQQYNGGFLPDIILLTQLNITHI